MSGKRGTSQVERRRPRQARHPSKAFCLRVLRQLSAYLDGDLSMDVCAEIRRHLGACPNCELFVASLQQTVTLCRHATVKPLTPALKARLRTQILRAAGRV
ncbi:anti-sigma factor family protein [Nitrospira sp. Kam-Ns4a]